MIIKLRKTLENYKIASFYIDEIIALILIVIIALLMILRCFYGVEITDEAYYYADALSVIQGNIPYAYNSSYYVGMTFLMLPFMFIYKLFVSDLSGIFLYMRLCFVIFRFTILAYMYILLRQKYDRRKLLWGMILFVPYTDIIQAFSYNTIGMYMILLSGIIISCYMYDNVNRKILIIYFLAGMFSAIGVFAHVGQSISVIIYMLMILFLAPKEGRKKKNIFFVAGGITQISIVFIPILLQAGIKNTIKGCYELLGLKSSLNYYTESWQDKVIECKELFGFNWMFMTIAFLIVLSFLILLKKQNHDKYVFKDCVVYAVFCVSSLSILSLIYNYSQIKLILGGIALWLIIIYFIFFRDNCILLCVPFACISFFGVEVLLTDEMKVSSRVHFLYPIVFLWYLFFLSYNSKFIQIISKLCVVLIAVCLVRYNYVNIYRDSPIEDLKYRVESGVYKGLYTTEHKAKDICEIEEYISDITNPNELVSFRDNAPFAYLMNRGGICDVRTWDEMEYTYKYLYGNDRRISLYKYYERTNMIPDKIIYIDFGRDEMLSIEDPEWMYNEFVNEYYNEKSEVQLNDMFRVLVFEYKGNFDGNYYRWIG